MNIENIVNVCEKMAHEEMTECGILPDKDSDKHGDARGIIKNAMQECITKYIESTENDMLKTFKETKIYLGMDT